MTEKRRKVNPRLERQRTQIVLRRRKVAAALGRHFTEAAIAEQLKVSQATVSRDKKAILQKYEQSGILDVHKARLRELMELDVIEEDASTGFLSKQSPDFLRVRLGAKERRAKLLGLDKPERYQELPPPPMPAELDLSRLSRQQLELLEELLAIASDDS